MNDQRTLLHGSRPIHPVEDMFGITLREHFAGLAMQGFLSAKTNGPITAMAVGVADQLVRDLVKDPTQLAQELKTYAAQMNIELAKLKEKMKAQQSAEQKERV